MKRMGVSPVAALHFKQKQQDLKANRIDQIREEERNKEEKKRLEIEQSEFIGTPPNQKGSQDIDMHAIKAKAQAKNQQSTKHKLYLSHLSMYRQSKYAKEVEDSKFENVKKSLKQMAVHLSHERERIFVPKESYDKVFKDANHFSNVGDSGYEYFYPEN